MAQAQKKKELQIMTDDKAGMLAEVTSLISNAGVNIEAMCAYGMQGKGTFLLITSDNAKVKEAAVKKGWEVSENDVLVTTVGDQAGTANEVAQKSGSDQ